jgi:hypothetical protein
MAWRGDVACGAVVVVLSAISILLPLLPVASSCSRLSACRRCSGKGIDSASTGLKASGSMWHPPNCAIQHQFSCLLYRWHGLWSQLYLRRCSGVSTDCFRRLGKTLVACAKRIIRSFQSNRSRRRCTILRTRALQLEE